MAKIYTRTGDSGLTDYPGYGQKLPKDHPVMKTMGDLDELNACLGVGLAHTGADEDAARMIRNLQNSLFTISTQLASMFSLKQERNEADEQVTITTKRMVEALELEIDRMQSELPALKSFIIPGGAPLTAHLHQARAVCRRAERSMVELSRIFQINSSILAFVNRLSDHIFVLARWTDARAGGVDIPWLGNPPTED